MLQACILFSAVATETVISHCGHGSDAQKGTIAGQPLIDTRSSSVKEHMQIYVTIPTDKDRTHPTATTAIVQLVYHPYEKIQYMQSPLP